MEREPVKKTNIKLSREALDDLILDNQDVKPTEYSKLYEYTTASGIKVCMDPVIIAALKGDNHERFLKLLGQTYPVWGTPGEPYLMTDYLFLAKEDGSRGAPWTRDPRAFEFFIRALSSSNFAQEPITKNGKTYIEAPFVKRYIFDGRQKERDGIGE